MKKTDIITLVCVLALVISILSFLVIYYTGKNEDFIYNEHLDEIVLVLSDKVSGGSSVNVSLQEMAYYIINVEGNIHSMALQYNSSNPSAYWNIKVGKGMYTMRDYAKDLTMENCIRDNIYYLEALKGGMTLTEEEKKLALNDVETILKNLNGRQMGVADFTKDSLYSIEEKIYMSGKYVNSLVKKGYSKEELESDGEYFKELKDKYTQSIDEGLWERVKLGNLTVMSKEE